MAKVQDLAGIAPTIPFTEFSFYNLYRESFETFPIDNLRYALTGHMGGSCQSLPSGALYAAKKKGHFVRKRPIIVFETLDLRELKNIDAVINAIETLKRERAKFESKLRAVKFTTERISERTNISRVTLSRNETLRKIIKAYTPEELENERVVALERENEELKAIIKEKERKEREGEAFYTRIRFANLVNENKSLRRQAEIEEKNRKCREDDIVSLKAEIRELKENASLQNPRIQVELSKGGGNLS